ncbi:helix-turn-helix transcriptional regulator [Anaerocolumna sp. MB42-C2]|uniref:helix-turn-helix transcriptional regulator n=1 Tax=Anaerocolumna sp. MB42-C2 TaxID=3070997 RepID=UPI0027E07633|nr:helix-turn-helix transcriptional regulator [Anaerocolumna sp. MB42-C2]WMJ85646.1 helix-turn-helix transcriptional regulator [Anaerocolumna sp. MB42-C2]
MALITKMREYRAKNNMTQDELAILVGVRRETIINLEKGRYNPSLKLAMDIAGIFSCTVEDLFYFDEEVKE